MYGKIFESMYEGTLYGQWEAIVTMQQLIVLADENGIVDMTPPAIAGKTSIPLEIIEKGLKILAGPDPYSRTPGNNGVRIKLIDDHKPWGWYLVNHEKYTKLQKRIDKRNADRERIAEKRKSLSDKGCRKVSQSVANVAHEDEDKDEDKNKKIGRKRAPKDFVVNVQMYEWAASELNLPADTVTSQTKKFLDHEFKSARKDWNAVWRNWMRNHAEWRKDEKAQRSGNDFESVQARNRRAAGLD